MKFILKTYGWSAEFIGNSLSKTNVSLINKLLDDRGVEDISEIRFDLDDLEDFNIWDGDILHTLKPLDNHTLLFEVFDESENSIIEFGIEDILENKDIETDDYEVFPSKTNSVYLSIDEFKGGIFSFEFESDEKPQMGDFTFSRSSILTPNGEWGIIDKIFFNHQEIQVWDYLDAFGKSSLVEVYHYSD